MADAIVRTKLVPLDRAVDIEALEVAVDAVAGTDAVSVNYGTDNEVVIDVAITDASDTTAAAVIDTVLATAYEGDTIGDYLQVHPGYGEVTEKDPTLAVTSPASLAPAITEEGTDRVVVVVDPSLFGADAITSASVTYPELTAAAIPIAVRGLPNGHESQKVSYPPGRVILKIGPAPAATAGEYDVVVNIEDENGRTPASALTFQVYVSDGTAPVLDSDDADDSLTLDDAAATDTTILSGVSQTPLLWELVSALDQATGLVDISDIITLDDQADFDISDGSSTCELIINPEDEVTPADTYDIIVRATDGLGLTDTYTLELVLTDT